MKLLKSLQEVGCIIVIQILKLNKKLTLREICLVFFIFPYKILLC